MGADAALSLRWMFLPETSALQNAIHSDLSHAKHKNHRDQAAFKVDAQTQNVLPEAAAALCLSLDKRAVKEKKKDEELSE